MKRGVLLIRADASASMGTGHLMRCLALAQAWQIAGGTAVAVVAEGNDTIEERLRRASIEVIRTETSPGSEEDARHTGQIAQDRQAAWVVLDGYRFDSACQKSLRSRGLRVLLIDDDVHADYYATNLVLNQNAHATADLYTKRDPDTRLLLGPRYAMLRKEFDSWRDWPREIAPVARRVLITMGGSDPDNFTLLVVEALQLIKEDTLQLVVVVGGSNPHAAILEESVAGLSASCSVRLVRNVSNMPELMAWADVAVSAAGTTCWEMCLLGLPALVVDLAPNQVPVARRLDELGVARHVGSSRDCSAVKIVGELSQLLESDEIRRQMSIRGRELVDGRGASRVCAAMLCDGVQIRRATEADCRMLWEWANEPGVRASAFSQGAIPWDDHRAWFDAKLSDADCTIFIGDVLDGQAIGQVRINRQSGQEAEIHVSVAREFRGAGYGSLLIDAAVGEILESGLMTKVNAFIRPENLASARAFERAGFQQMGETEVRGNRALHYCRERLPQ